MNFSDYLKETDNTKNLSKEQKLVLLIGKELEEHNYKLKGDESRISSIFKEFPKKEDKFSYTFIKNDNEYNLLVQNKKDGKYEITLSSETRTSSEEIKIDNYLKPNDNTILSSYIKERITNFEKDSFISKEPKTVLKCENRNNYYMNINNNPNTRNFMANDISDNNYDNYNNNFRQQSNNDNYYTRPNFCEVNDFEVNFGYNDLHGDLPNFFPSVNRPYMRPKGNLVGPDDFRVGGRGGVRYDPITPFPNFDFVPQYDNMGPGERAIRNKNNIGGMGLGGNNFIGGGMGGGFNPFI